MRRFAKRSDHTNIFLDENPLNNNFGYIFNKQVTFIDKYTKMLNMRYISPNTVQMIR